MNFGGTGFDGDRSTSGYETQLLRVQTILRFPDSPKTSAYGKFLDGGG